MKKRVLSLLLVLVMLLGLLPTAALATEDEGPGAAVTAGVEEGTLLNETLSEPLADSVQAFSAGAAALSTRAVSPSSVQPKIVLAGASQCRYHVGDNWNNGFGKDNDGAGVGSYDGGIRNAVNSGSSATINLKESGRSKKACYLLQPFTLSVEVPAYTTYAVTFKADISLNRNANGASWCFMEMVHNTDGAAYNNLFSTQNKAGAFGPGSKFRSSTDNRTFAPSNILYPISFTNDTAQTKTVSLSFALVVGNSKSTSALKSYHHQLESRLTLTTNSVVATKRITYNNNGGSGSTLAQSFGSDSITLAPAPTKTGYDFQGWKDSADGKLYAAGATYSQNRGAALTAQWRAKTMTVTFNANGGTVSQSQKSVTYGETYGTLPTPTRTGYKFEGWTSGPTGGQVFYTHTKVTETKNHTLYAYWTQNRYAIKFDGNGLSYGATCTVGGGNALGTLPAPTRTGYTLDGWYTAKTGGTKVESTTVPTADATYYARWTPKTVAVTLNANGGTVTGSPKNVTYGQTYGDLPTPTRAGYAFTGWYTSGGGKVESATKVTNANAHTLYARWSRNTYTVTFNANGGSAVSSRTVNAGDKLGTLPTSTKAGYTFNGWFNGDTQVTEDTVPTGDVTYTAKWTANQYKVTFDPNGGKVSQTSMTVTSGLTYGTLPTPTRTGYTFDGWFTAATGGQEMTYNTYFQKAANQTLYAHWTAKKYTVTLKVNDNGITADATREVTYGETYGANCVPAVTRTGYTLDGWYTAPVGGTKVATSTTVATASDHILYAHWTAKTMTVTFDANGGEFPSEATTAKTVTFGQPYGSLPVPTQSGKTFAGWFTAASRGQLRTADSLVTAEANHTLYAIWSSRHSHSYGPGAGASIYGDFVALSQTGDSSKGILAVNDVLGKEIGGTPGYYLTEDVTVDATTTVISNAAVNGTLAICLNGHKLTYTGTEGSAFVVEKGSTLYICDCNGSNGSHTITSPATGESVTIQGGLITRSVAKTSVGTGVRVYGGGTFNLYGGAIAGIATAADDGSHGAVRVEGAFHMYGGELCHNKIGCGGAVNICDDRNTTYKSHFYLHGGSIHHNYASLDDGGGVCVNESAACTISGGSIVDNVAKSGAGGIHSYGGSITLSGSPVIQNNTTQTGGTNYNIRLDGGAKLTVSEGFSSAAPIGVSSTTAPTADAPVAVGTEGSGAYARYFVADAAGQEVVDNSGVLALKLHSHPLCGGSSCDHNTDIHDAGNKSYTALTLDALTGDGDTKTLPKGSYYLAGDLTINDNVQIENSSQVRLCLNGHTLKIGMNKTVTVPSTSQLFICDCAGGGTFDLGSSAFLYNNGHVNLFGGAMTADSYVVTNRGGGSVNVYGGTMTSTSSGGACIVSNQTLSSADNGYGKVNIYGGTLTSEHYGVYNAGSNSTVNVYGGTITGKDSGIRNNGTVNVSGGTIRGEKYGISCGNSNSNITVTGGVISSAEYGVYISGTGIGVTRTFSGGTITGGKQGISGYITTLSGAPTITGEEADICAWSAFTAENLTGKFSVAYHYAVTEATTRTITTAATDSQLEHFIPAKDGEGLRDVVDGEGKHTLQLYRKHMHGDVEYDYALLTDNPDIKNGGHYLLAVPVTLVSGNLTIPAGDTVDLCLNGNTLTGKITVNGTLNLYDCKGTGKITNSSDVPLALTAGSAVHYYGGTLERTGVGSFYIAGPLYLHAYPKAKELAMNTNGKLYIATPLEKPASKCKINCVSGLVEKNKPLTFTANWETVMGDADPAEYFAPFGPTAKIDKSADGEAVLRYLHVDMDGVRHYLAYSGKLTAAELAAPAETREGYIWGGWYNGESLVTADTKFTDDATLTSKWTACDHSGNTATPTKVEPTCTTAGSTTYTCSKCGLAVVEETPAQGHDFDTDKTWHKDDPDSGVHYHKCSRCDQRQDEAEHTWNDGEVTTEPTAGTEGVMTFTCTVCGATTTGAIPALVAHSVTYTVDDYTVGEAPTQADTVKGGSFSLPTGLTRTGYTLSGWALLDEEGIPGGEVLTGTFTMPDRDVELQVRWERIPNYALQPGETIVLEDGTVIKNETDNTVTIDQNGDGDPETTITLPDGGSVTIQESQDGEKDKVVVPPGAKVETTPGDGGQGPVITIGDGDGTVDPSGKVEAPVGTTIEDKDGNKITITEGSGGTIDPEGVVTFPEGEDGKVTVTTPEGETVEVDVPGGGDGLDVTPGGVPLVNNPDGSLSIPDGQGGSTTITVPEGDEGAELDDNGNIILPGGSKVETEDKDGNKTETTIPGEGGAVTPGGGVASRRPDRELFTVTDIDPEHITGSIAISGDADKMEWRKVTDPESDWQNVGNTATATLDELPEGSYQFRYKAQDGLDASLPREIRVNNNPEGGKALNIAPGITGGTVSAVRTRVKPGLEVRLTVKTDKGYRLDALTVTYGDGETITPVWNRNTLTYNFIMPNADVTVTADFISASEPAPKTFTVIFDPNGGSGVASQNVREGKTAAKPAAPTREGYTFGGWFTDAACTREWSFSTTVTRSMTLYAKWEKVAKTFTVSFDAQGGQPTPADQTVEEGKLAIKPASPARAEHDFGGWFTEADGGKPWQFNVYTVTGDVTLYAIWTAKSAGSAVTEDPVVLPGGGTVSKDPDTGDVTITPPSGGDGSTTTITPPSGGGDVTVDPDSGEVTVPGGSTVDPGNGAKVELPDGGKVDEEGNITLPDGGSVTVPDGEGGSTTITAPDGGGTLKPTDDGKLEVPGGSTVKTEDGAEVTVPDDGGKVGGDGSVTVPGGSTVTIPDGEGGKTEVTVPDGEDEITITSTGDGKVEVPGGSTVKTDDGAEVTVPEVGGKVGGDGSVTVPGGSTVTVTDGEDGRTEVTVPDGGEATITPTDDGKLEVPGGSTVKTDDGAEVTVPEEGGKVSGDGSVTVPGGSSVTIPDGNGGKTTVTVPGDGESTVILGGGVEVPAGSTVKPEGGAEVTVGDGGGKVSGDGSVTVPGGSAVTIPDGEGGKTEITVPEGGEADIKPTDDGKVEVPGGSTVKTEGDGPEVTVPDEGGKVSGDGTVTVPGGSTVTIPDGNGGKTQVTVPEGGESDIIPAGDGKLDIPTGSTVTTKDGATITVDSGSPATVAPDGTLTLPNGGTVTVTAPDGKSETVEVPAGGKVDPDDYQAKPVPSYSDPVPNTYKPTVQQPEHGKITVSPAAPKKGDKVTVTVTPEDGYELDTITVTDRRGKSVALTKNPDGTYSYTQPGGRVTISAVMKEVAAPTVCLRDNTCPVARFTDADVTAWYHDGVHYCVEKGLMQGVSETAFAPAMDTSRAMIATILWRQTGSPEAKAELTYPDCVKDSWYAKAVAWASETGVVKGYGSGDFGPNDPITREQMAAMLYRYAGSPKSSGTLDSFSDSGAAGTWAAEALRWAVEEGILTGKGDGILDPQGQATRAEAAAMLARYLKNEK